MGNIFYLGEDKHIFHPIPQPRQELNTYILIIFKSKPTFKKLEFATKVYARKKFCTLSYRTD